MTPTFPRFRVSGHAGAVHLRGSALGFRNLVHHIARAILETGGFNPNYTLDSEEP